MQLTGSAICTRGRQCCIQCATGIDYQQITSFEVSAKLAEPRVNHAIVGAVGNHQAHLVTRKAMRLRRFACFKFRWQSKVERTIYVVTGCGKQVHVLYGSLCECTGRVTSAGPTTCEQF